MQPHLLSEVKDEIKTGDLLAFTVRRFGSLTSFVLWLYQKFRKVKFSHVGVAVRLGDRLFIVEAVSPRVTITPISKVKDFYLIPTRIAENPKIKATEEDQISFLMDFVEVKYSLVDMITHYIGMDVNDNGVYCSELASAFYYHIGLLLERDSGHTPQTLVEAVMKKVGIEEPIHIVTDRGNL